MAETARIGRKRRDDVFAGPHLDHHAARHEGHSVTNPSPAAQAPAPDNPQPKSRKRLFADITPLRESPEYRRLWFGQSLSGLGNQMTTVAVPVQVYDLTHSSLAVGFVGLAVAVPLVAVGLLGSALTDAMDRRRLVVGTSSVLTAVSLAFGVQAFTNVRQVWLLYLLLVVQSTVMAVDTPARRTFVPRLLPPERLPAAMALSQLAFQITVVGGPLIAGLLIVVWSFQGCYVLDAVSFAATLYAVLRMRAMPVQAGSSRPGLRAVAEGLRFLRSQPVVSTVMLVDLNATVLGMPFALFPAFAYQHFGGGSVVVGLLYAAPAMGGVLCGTFSGRFSYVRRQGLAMMVAVGIWGVAVAGFGVARILWLAVILLAVAGGADMANAVFRNTIIQMATPDEYRGRVNGVAYIVGAGGPRLGDLEAGVIASLTSPAISAVSGGLGCLVGMLLLGVLRPALARYKAKAVTG